MAFYTSHGTDMDLMTILSFEVIEKHAKTLEARAMAPHRRLWRQAIINPPSIIEHEQEQTMSDVYLIHHAVH